MKAYVGYVPAALLLVAIPVLGVDTPPEKETSERLRQSLALITAGSCEESDLSIQIDSVQSLVLSGTLAVVRFEEHREDLPMFRTPEPVLLVVKPDDPAILRVVDRETALTLPRKDACAQDLW